MRRPSSPRLTASTPRSSGSRICGSRPCGRLTMRRPGLLSGRFTRMCALMLMASACSTGLRLSPADIQPSIPSHLLVHPNDPPKVQRTTDLKTGAVSMNGGDATVSLTDLYAYIGGVKSQLDGLIDAVVAKDAPAAKRKHKIF